MTARRCESALGCAWLIAQLVVLGLACAAAILAGEVVGHFDYWRRRRRAMRRLRRWRQIREPWRRAAEVVKELERGRE